MTETKIEWTDHSENPIRTRLKSEPSIVGHYCEKVNAGCTNCYASNLQKRFKMPAFGSGQHADEVEHFLCTKTLDRIRRRKTPTKFFLGDMTDLFGDWVEWEWMASILATADVCSRHTFQILTKRPENIRKLWHTNLDFDGNMFAFGELTDSEISELDYREYRRDNIWLGTSVANQETAEQAIPELLKCRDLCKHLFLSVEPLVGPVDLTRWLWTDDYMGDPDVPGGMMPITESSGLIDWVIVGGESGQNARPCQVEWIESIVKQCGDAGVACFVKQLGAKATVEGYREGRDTGPRLSMCLKHSKGGDISEWPEALRVRQFPGEVLT